MKTAFALMAEFDTSQIPLDRCCHIFGIDAKEAGKRAQRQRLPVVAYRLGSQKSPWIVHVEDLARYIDETRAAAQADKAKIDKAA